MRRLVFRQGVDAVTAADPDRVAVPVGLLHRRSSTGQPECAGLEIIRGHAAAVTKVIATEVARVAGATVIGIGVAAIRVFLDRECYRDVDVVAGTVVRTCISARPGPQHFAVSRGRILAGQRLHLEGIYSEVRVHRDHKRTNHDAK